MLFFICYKSEMFIENQEKPIKHVSKLPFIRRDINYV